MGDLDNSGNTALTGPDGRFAIDVMPSYTRLHAIALRGDSVWQGEVKADGAPFDWTITLKPPADPRDRVVLVHVLGPDGTPVPGGRAWAIAGAVRKQWDGTGWDGSFMFAESAFAVAGGWFPVLASRWREGETPEFLVGAARDGNGHALPIGSAIVRVDPRGPPAVEVRLPPGAAVRGRIEQPDGSPAVALEVSLTLPWPDGVDARKMEFSFIDVRSRTDADGRFDFGGFPLGEATLILGRPEWSDDLKNDRPGQDFPWTLDGRAIVIRIPREISLQVTVSDDQGSPIHWASVNASESHYPGFDPKEPGGATEEDGSCTLTRLSEGREYHLSISASGFVTSRTRCVPAGQDVRVTLQRGGVIRGTVLGPDGEPIPGAPLAVDPAGDSGWSWDRFDHGDGRRFVVENLPAGPPVRLSLADGERRFATVEAAVGATDVVLHWPEDEDRLTLVLGSVEWLGGTGVVLRDGSRALVSFPDPAPVVTFSSKDLPPLVDIQVGPTRDGHYAFLRRVPSNGFRRVTLDLNPGLVGHVKSVGGTPVEFARCTVTTVEGFVMEFETDLLGQFNVLGMPPGRAWIVAKSVDGREATVEVSVPSNSVSVELPAR